MVYVQVEVWKGDRNNVVSEFREDLSDEEADTLVASIEQALDDDT